MFNFVRNKNLAISHRMKFRLLAILFVLFGAMTALAQKPSEPAHSGDERLPEYLHLLQGKRVGVLANHNSFVEDRHLVDTLLSAGVDVELIFAPEDGFRAEGVVRQRDTYMGIEVLNLTRSPKANDVFRCDVVVCDLCDTGVRTSHSLRALVRLMGVCANIGVPLVVLDRPNPFGRCTDGAVVEPQYRTSEDMLPLPLLHGMTLGELARMANGEGWLTEGAKCPLTVVPYVESTDETPFPTIDPIFSVGLAENVPIVVENCEGAVTLLTVVENYANRSEEQEFFLGEEFDRQMGVSYVREMIELGYTAEDIESMWSGDVEGFATQREEYLIYEN